MDYEDVVKDYVGECGPFQILILLVVCLSSMLGGEYISHNFIAGDQEHWCHISQLNDVPYEQQKYIAIPKDDDGNFVNCEAFNISYGDYTLTDFYNWNRTIHETSSVISCTSWVYDQSQYVTTISSEWDLVCDEKWKNSFISTISMIGSLIGSFVGGSVSDAIGRRPTLIIFMITRLLGDLLTPLAPGYGVLLLSRFMIGLSSMVTWIVTYTFLTEITGNKYRPIFGMAANLFFSFGYTIISLFAYFIRTFRLVGAAITVPSTFFLVAFIIFPESARWLLVNKKTEKLDKTFRKMAAANGRIFPEKFNYDYLVIVDEETKTTKSNSTSSLRAWKRYLTNGKLLFQLVIVLIMWFTVSVVYHALAFNTGTLAGNIYLNTTLLGLVEIPGLLLTLVTVRSVRFGRKGTCGWFLTIAGVANFLTIPFILSDNGTAVTTISLIGKCFIAGAFTTIHIFTTELFPTEIRNSGLGVSSVISSLGGIIAPFIDPLINVWEPLPTLLFGIFGVIAGCLILIFLPETLGQKMAETVDELIARIRTGTMVEYGSKYDIKFDNLSIKQSKTESVADDGKINLSHVEEERL